MTDIKFDLYPMLTKLESIKKKRFSPGDISIAVKGRVSRQTVHSLLHNDVKNVNLRTLAALVDFFAKEGLPVTISDLFTITEDAP